MRKFVVAMIGLALVVALILTGVLVMFMTGNMPSFNFYANLEMANRQVFPAAGFDSLSVGYSSERITLLAGNDGEIVLEEYMSRWEDDMLANVSLGANSLDIRAGRRSIGFLTMWRCKVKVYVPRQFLADVSLDNSSGTIHLEDDFHFKSLAIDNTSGSVRMQDVVADGDIRVSASSGSISAEELVAGGDVVLDNTSGSIKPGKVQGRTITAENTSGSIRFDSAVAGTVRARGSSGSIAFDELEGEFDLSNTSGSVTVERGVGGGKATSSSGSIKVTLDEMTSDVSLSTTSASCKLTVPRDTGFAFQAKTTSGSIHVPDENGVTFNEKGNQASGNVGGGGTLRVNMESSSGSVRVEYN